MPRSAIAQRLRAKSARSNPEEPPQNPPRPNPSPQRPKHLRQHHRMTDVDRRGGGQQRDNPTQRPQSLQSSLALSPSEFGPVPLDELGIARRVVAVPDA